MQNNHQMAHMQEALRLAALGSGTVSPNPMVGCVIVKDDKVVGMGFHQKAGGSHAEIFALHEAGLQAKEADVYLSLEPCSHHGKTPPCVEALIKAGVKKVYIATKDPNPLVNGRGIDALRAEDIIVEVGLLQEEAIKLNKIFFHYIQKKRPYVIAKWAMSLDGKTITNNIHDRHITSPLTQQSAHAIRQTVDAILIGANTALLDNPQLTIRIPNTDINKQPLRIVLSSSNRMLTTLKIFDPSLPGKTMVVSTKLPEQSFREYCTQHGIEILITKQNREGLVDLTHLLALLAEREISSLLVEGGMSVHQQFFNEQLVDEVCVYLAPIFIGNAKEKIQIPHHQLQSLPENDYLLTATMSEEIKYV